MQDVIDKQLPDLNAGQDAIMLSIGKWALNAVKILLLGGQGT